MHISSKRLLNALGKGWVGVLLAFIAVGCEWGDRTITLVRPDTDNLQVVYTDTITVLRSTVMKDSLFTANGNLISGRSKDNVLGEISARTFMNVYSATGITIPERAVYDSIALATKYVYYYGDTTQRYQISAYQLADDITSGPYYNQRAVNYSSSAVGRASIVPKPRRDDSLRIKLNDELGLLLFNEGLANNIRTQDALLKYFKGLALVVDDSYQSGFLGFSKDRTYISLYYHVDGPDGITRGSVNLPVGQFYNQIVNDRTNTAFESLVNSQQRLSTDVTDGISVVQSGVGLMTRLDFPFLHQFGAHLGKVVVNRAFLRIDLARNQESRGVVPPRAIALYGTGNNNAWELSSSPVTDARGTPLIASFKNDTINNQRFYEVDVSGIVMQLVQEKVPSNVGFLVGPLGSSGTSSSSATTYATSLDRLIMPKGSVKLQVYYTILTE